MIDSPAPRQMVGQRKGAPQLPTQDDGPDAAQPDGTDATECPNCKCMFDPATMEVIAPPPDMAEEMGEGEAMGADLESSGQPVPGKFGAAADAARGTDAMAGLLASLSGRG